MYCTEMYIVNVKNCVDYGIIYVFIFLYFRYMRPAVKGDTISIVAECLKVGKTMAFVNVDIFNKSDGNKVVAQGRHTKLL